MIIFQHKNSFNVFKKLFLINIKVEYKKFNLKLWISWSSNWWSGLRWCDCDVQIIANLKSRLWQRLAIISTLLTRTRTSDVPHSIPWSTYIGKHECKIKECSFPSCFNIHFFHQTGQLFQSRIHPCVNLQLISWDISPSIFIGRMMTSTTQKNTK